ncbi:MAG: hypothetical protein HY515_03775 [Candidatus Aenigmarchaeota archaeon]|nr:hypothetical protein [Candidatus Aenigmarchaeota archaeon]
MKFNQNRMKNLKGDIWFVSDFFFIITVFFTTMILLFSMSIARLIVGNLIDFTVHVTFLDFSLNTENALVAATEIKLNPDDPQMKRILSNAAFRWDGSQRCGSPPCWDGSVYAEGRMYDSYSISENIFDRFVKGPYIFELRKEFDVGGAAATKSVLIAARDNEKILVDPEVAEIEFYLPYGSCASCSKTAVYRLYSTVK